MSSSASYARGSGVRGWALSLAGALTVAAGPLAAQQADSLTAPPAETSQPKVIRWYHAAAVIGGTSLLMLLDGPVRDFAQEHRSTSTDDAASFFRHFGQPEVYGTVSLGLVAAGLVSGNHNLARVGGRAVASVGLAGASTLVFKSLFGRERPDVSPRVVDLDPLSGSDALPSGHTSLAFALATSLSQDIHRPWATVGLYTLATGTAFSRINDNKHWLSDVAVGAIVGITSAKLASGRWQVFGIHTPSFLLTPSGSAAIGWHATF
jgi:membrane-associated phospholipid phosphatase